MSLGLAALAIAQGELAAGVKGGNPVRFISPRIGEYRASVGRDPHIAEPWCAEAVYWCFQQAWTALVGASGSSWPENPCPRTASALHIWLNADPRYRTQQAAPGCVFVLDRGKGRGHVGFVEAVSVDGKPGPLPGQIVTIEPDTNGAGSTTGDSWGRHTWHPDDGERGTLLGYLAF